MSEILSQQLKNINQKLLNAYSTQIFYKACHMKFRIKNTYLMTEVKILCMHVSFFEIPNLKELTFQI